MVGYVEKSKGGDFTPSPEGVHLMVCSQVIDLGTQPGSQMYPAARRKIVIRWELPEERIEIDGKDLPIIHTEKYTWSFHENANLRGVLENWRGKAFTDDDFAGPPNGFHVSKLIGAPMRGQIIHEKSGDKTYANLSTAMAAGFKSKDDWPKLEADPIFFDLDDFKKEVFYALPEYYQGLIKGSPEYQELFGTNDGNQGDDYREKTNTDQPRDLDDEIPF